MKNKPKTKVSRQQIFVTLIWLAIGAVVGYVLGSILAGGGRSGLPLGWRLLLIPLAIIAWLFCVGFHELGHVIAGLSSRFSFRMFILGPFMLEQEDGKLHFKWNREFNLAGGMAMMLPEKEHRLRSRFARYAAGGPTASLLLALVAILISASLPESVSVFGRFLQKSFFLTGLISGLIFLLSIVPMQAAGFLTDGARILQLLRGGPRAELDLLMIRMIALLKSGLRPAELDIRAMERGLELGIHNIFSAGLHQYLYLAYLDRGDVESAVIHLQELMESVDLFPPPYQGALFLEEAFFYAFYEHWPEKARHSFRHFKASPFVPEVERLRTEAALAFAEGRLEEAHQLAQRAIEALPKLIEKGKAPLYREWMEKILRADEAPQEEE